MKRLYILAFLAMLLTTSSCILKQDDATKYVDPLIGTGGHGHTYPGASLPFGMVQLSPDTRTDNWDACSGYHASDSSIIGFSHTHLSGTGCGDYGDIRMMPIAGDVQLNVGPIENTSAGYRSAFDPKEEVVAPAYYSVPLKDYGVLAELTATTRTGMHRYTFPEGKDAHLIIDLKESTRAEEILGSSIQFISDHEVVGVRRTSSWAANHPVYFYASFSQPFSSYSIYDHGEHKEEVEQLESDHIKAVIDFDSLQANQLIVKVALSAVSVDGAKANMEEENDEWNFDAVRQDGINAWNDKLTKVTVISDDEDLKKIFYTALYHAYLSPDVFSDVDGRYLGHDQKIHEGEDHTQYTVFSLWDTYRAEHPLLSIMEPEATLDMVNSMLNIYQQSGKLPVWELAGNETNCMIGYHAVPVIYDAYVKGIDGFDAELAFEAMKASALQEEFGTSYMTKIGYVPGDKVGASVSRTLEYAYDDWCIAQMAKALGKEMDYEFFTQRAQSYKNIFDQETGFMRGKRNGGFAKPFDPNEVTFMLTEANTWQYNFYTPQDIQGLIDLYGGQHNFEAKLDEMFHTETVLSGRHQPDISGLIGQYAHGNEPSHHMAYLYDYIGKPWKTQRMVRRICKEMYTTAKDGYSGNEDCGQMSAWYVLSSMGFYPVTPGDSVMAIGSPVFDEVILHQDNGNNFMVKARNQSDENIYIQKAFWNGKPYNKSYIPISMILEGGELTFDMGPKPNREWGVEEGNYPTTRIDDHHIIAVPNIDAPARSFKGEMQVKLTHYDPDVEIRYTLNGEKPYEHSTLYEGPINIDAKTQLRAIACKKDGRSKEAQADFYKLPDDWKIKIITPYGGQYTAGGDMALIDGIKGSDNFTTGDWQGYWKSDMIIEIDMARTKPIKQITTGFLQDTPSWIWMPKEVVYEVAGPDKKWRTYAVVKSNTPERVEKAIRDYSSPEKSTKARYVRVSAKNFGNCPEWHPGHGLPVWIFADEINIK